METFRPYSTRLARGTLLMVHSPTVNVRYAHVRRVITVESLGIIGAGLLATFAGWIGEEAIIVVSGLVAMLIGVGVWCVRHLRLQYRRHRTPGIIFISEDGVGAIMPNNCSALLPWGELRAREIFFQSRVSNTGNSDASTGGGWGRGMLLRGNGRRLYITCDLEGYNDLIDILSDLQIPISTSYDGLFGEHGGITNWRSRLERWAWQERN